MIVDASFGTWVRRRRKALDLTQQELARRVGCSVSLIFKIESDERRPSRQVAELLAQHLEIPADQRELFLKVARREKAVDHLDPDGPLPQPAPASPALPASLPAPLTALIGREHEQRAILQQIQNPACRLLTLTGPGGIGKTRLALEVARQLQDRFQHGACFVSLVGTSSSEFIIPAIADVLGYSFSGAIELKTQLFHFLREKELLLILDNLEHLLSGIEVLDELLSQSPYVKLLATSREQINVRAEWTFELQGLPVPLSADLTDLEANSAAVLFLQRVKQSKQDFSPSRQDLEAIRRICQLVEGSPLGLELAATWVRMMSLEEIAGEIERSLDFLTTATRDVPARHRSIRAVFDHSWDLLSEEERRVMTRLSVFRGGFTREAAQHVAGASLFDLSALVNKSLLRYTEDHLGRYDFHELIRQYAYGKLQDNPAEDARAHERHADYYAAWLHRQSPRLESPQLPEALTQMTSEIDNLRYAWDWMVSHRQTTNLEQSLPSLFILHDIRNWIRQGAALFEQGVMALQSLQEADGRDDQHSIVLGELMTCQAHMRWHLGELRRARGLLQGAFPLLESHRDRPMLAELLLYLSILEYSEGNYPAARQLAEECVALNREQGRGPGTGYALSNLGIICVAQGKYETAYAHLKESVLRMRSIGHARGTAITLTRLAMAALQVGRLDEAGQALEESLEITRKLNDRWGVGNALNTLGLLASARGELKRAESLIRESLTLYREDGDQILQACALADLGYVLDERHAEREARVAFREALQIAMRIQAAPIKLYALVGLATLGAKEWGLARAFELAMYSGQHPASNQQTKDRAAKLSAALENQLTLEKVEEIKARAQDKPLEQLVSEVLSV